MLRAALLIVLALLSVACKSRAQPPQQPPDYTHELPPGASALREVDAATLPPVRLTPDQRMAFQNAIGHSLAYLGRPSSLKAFPAECGISHDQAKRSLEELRKLLATADDDALDRAIHTRFRAFMSVGCDDRGTVLFTGYYTPIFDASYTKGGPFIYPIYKRPADLVGGSVHEGAQRKQADGKLTPYPAAAEIESSGMLKGQELAWLADPFEAYVVRIQGSAKLRLPDGKVIDVGYAGTNGHEYKSIGKVLIAEGRIAKDKLNFFTMRQFFHDHPEDLPRYAAANPRFTFFSITSGGPFGSLGVPVTSDVSVATNKQIFPPAAPMLVETRSAGADGLIKPYVGLRLDQDTGGAMRAPGRADLYMGVGEQAERRAGVQEHEGKMWYLILKD